MPKRTAKKSATVEVVEKKVNLPALIQMRPYQERWVDDRTRFKLAVKSARIGFSFGTGVEALLDAIERGDGGTTWTVLSAGKAQSVEFVEMVQKNLQAIGAVGQLYSEPFEDIEGVSSITQSRIQILDSRIIALSSNPRTARGYPGNAILDEFGHHPESYAIWAAITRQVALGHKLRALSTPNGEIGKYFDLCKDFGVTDGVDPGDVLRKGNWSIHWVDVHKAVREGCPISIDEMRDLIRDEDTFAQEFLCVFLKASGAWISLELVARAEDDNATKEWPSGYVSSGPVFGGIDVARDRDTTVLWIDEQIGDVSWTRTVLRIHGKPLTEQHDILAPFVQMTTRTAIDATGMGVGLYDMLNKSCRGRVMGINFAGSNEKHVRFKTDLAIRIKQKFENAKSRIPRDNDIRQELMSIKRESTATCVKFDAPRIELESAVAGGTKKKVYGHADSFWAKALCDLAAASAPAAVMAGADYSREDYAGARRGMMTQSAEFADRRDRGEDQPEVTGGLTVSRRSLWDSRT